MRNIENFFPIALVFVLLLLSPCMTSAKEIIVDANSDADYKLIQEAVNSSSPGDTVIVRPGTYNENVIVNVTRLTIKSESGNDEVLIEPMNANKSIFHIKANNVTISGLSIIGANKGTLHYSSGICLENVNNCSITGNTIIKNYSGLYLNNSTYNTISENFFFNNEISLGGESSRNNLTRNIIENCSISLAAWSSGNLIAENKISNGGGIGIACCGAGNVILGNTISNSGISAYDQGVEINNNMITDCHHGIDISQSPGKISNNTIVNCSIGIILEDYSVEISNNTIVSSAECGISIPDYGDGVWVYNNYFNNTLNVRLGTRGGSKWNNSLTPGTNIVGGPYIGGNFWAHPNGTGFSQICTDSNGDGIGDLPYNVNGSDFDYLPLVSISKQQKPVLPVANFSTNITQNLAPVAIQFRDLSKNAIVWSWDFDNDGIIDSTKQNPAYVYTTPGNYTVNLTVNNGKYKDSKIQEITLQEAKIPPVAGFSANVTSGPVPLSILFTDLSQNATARSWDFGDGLNSSEENPIHTYHSAGTYTVNLTVSNTKGTASKLYTFIVLPARRVDGQFILTETQITKSEEHPGTYAIYGDRIVWTDWRNGWYNNYDIYMYDLSTYKETQITTSKSNQMEPAIYGDRIVWMDDRNGGGREYGQYVGNWDIYMYDLSTHKETQITTNESNQMEPAIYGDRIVWMDGRNGGGWENGRLTGNWDIYLYDLSTSTEYQITTNNAMQRFPAIYGDRIVWEDNRSENWNIYMYDLSTHQEFQIATNLSYQQEPEIYEDRIVWVDHRSGIGNIYMYNISTSKETQITNKLSHSLPMGLDIYNDRIVYMNHSDQNIYMYDLSTSIETQITTSKSYLGYPKIFSDKILWIDYCNGSDDIYMCTISEKWQERKLPVANFSATPTSGKSPLYVHFTDLSDNATERNWDFENDGIVDSTDKNPVHVYTVPGTYTVNLTAVNENGITSKMAYLSARSISV